MNEIVNIKKTAVMKALKILESCGANYLVYFDGQKYKKSFLIRRENFSEVYKRTIDEMNAGEIRSFTIEREKASRMRGAITSYCSQKWGKDSYVSEVIKTTVGFSKINILRVL